MAFYRSEEQASVQRWREGHECNLPRTVGDGLT
jgi:hypothetical protein